MTGNKRFTYSDVWGWNIDGFLNTMNGLDRKNNELKERVKELEKENEQLALSLNHRSIGEAIVDELNMLSEKLHEEQCRARPVTLTTHISDEDWKKFKKLFEIYCDNGGDY